MGLLFALVQSNIKWKKAPESFSENLVFRKKTGRNGMLKAMGAYGFDRSAMYYPSLQPEGEVLYSLKNHNVFGLATYKDQIGENWILHSGVTFGYDGQHIGISDTAGISKHKGTTELKLSFTGPLNKKINLNTGASLFVKNLSQNYRSFQEDDLYENHFISPILAVYAEAELLLTRRISSRLGARFESLSLTNEFCLSPRLALAFQTSRFSQISLAYGRFYQQAQEDYLIYNQALESEKAEHLIANFQYKKNSRIFRIEAYQKLYDKLIKYETPYTFEASAYTNLGEGYARGLDVFYRDSKTIPNGDFWLSYSLMDSKREYRDYTSSLTPSFISLHTLSLAYKQYIKAADSYFSLGYNFSSGRPYLDPNISEEIQKRTPACFDLGFSVFHFTQIFGKFTMFFAQVTNVLGNQNIYAYRFAHTPDASGFYASVPILPVLKRFFLIGMHVSFTGQTDI
jgi:hypothetical protein